MGGRQDTENNIILEFTQVGGQVKVTAIDPVTLKEASIMGPASAAPADLRALAVRKLRYVLNKKPE